VFLNLTGGLGAGSGLNQNQQNVANALNNFFNSGGALPPNFVSVFGLTGSSLANALSQLDGEAPTGAERAVFQLTSEFLDLMPDPFVNGRGNAALGGPAMGFAPDQQASLPPDIALAYASILKAPPKPSFDQRWSAWGTAYGGSNSANGNAVVGSNNVGASTFGFAGGMDYHLTPDTLAGFALAGAGTNWGLANAFGSGRSDAFQAGVYGMSWFGPAYVAGALSFSNHWFTTNRNALGDQLTANFTGQSYGARLEGGYRYAVLPSFAVTPYAALQAQDFDTPAYNETDVAGGGFGLAYAAMNATDVRSELGARFDDPTLLYGKPLILFGRLAWAHDWVSKPALGATFQSLPGASFTVNGTPIPQNSALTSAGAQLFLTPRWTLIAKFDGEFAPSSQTYAGTGTLRYTW
jgi:outer membrane autotransporter protein